MAQTKPTRADRIVATVQSWQANSEVHPLTCRNDSSHAPLVAQKQGRKVFLVCPTCERVQDWIPTGVVDAGSRMTLGKRRSSATD